MLFPNGWIGITEWWSVTSDNELYNNGDICEICESVVTVDVRVLEMQEFKDKVVLVTGAGKGIGRAIAQAFATSGAMVAANDITPVNLDETLANILAEVGHNGGGSVRDYVYDIANRMHVRGLVTQVVADWGRIDILINHAQVEPRAALLEMDEWDWRRTIDVNLGGPFFTMQAVGRVMREQNGGVIVNIIRGFESPQETQSCAACIASLSGLIGLTRAAANEFEGYQIRVYGLILGDIDIAPDPGADSTLVSMQKGKIAPENVAQVVLGVCRGDSNQTHV